MVKEAQLHVAKHGTISTPTHFCSVSIKEKPTKPYYVACLKFETGISSDAFAETSKEFKPILKKYGIDLKKVSWTR